MTTVRKQAEEDEQINDTDLSEGGDSDEEDNITMISMLYFFRQNKQLKSEYSVFSIHQRCWIVVGICALFFTVLCLFSIIASSVLPVHHHHYMTACSLSWVGAFCNVVGTMSCWIVFYRQTTHCMISRNLWQVWIRRYTSTFQYVLLLMVTIGFCLRFLVRVVIGECNLSDHNYLSQWNCNPYHVINLPPVDSIIGMIFLLVAYPAIFRESSVEIVVLSVLLIATTLLLGTRVMDSTDKQALSIFFSFLIVCVVVAFESIRQNLQSFMSHKKLQRALLQNRSMAASAETEMRNVLGNVAHDFKTPLSSFMHGIEMISQTVENYDKRTELKDSFQASLDTIKSVVKDVRDTNTFMLMTINRCLDFAKVSKGMKLSPKLETIDLMEALSMPLNCMKNIQQRVDVKWGEIEASICSHIITDKQWLQENILCLLSNAVKYSTEGDVLVSVSLRDLLKDTCAQDQPTSRVDSQRWQDRAMNSKIVPINYNECVPNKFLVVEVQDEGIGVPETRMNSLFSPFQQTQRLAGGTGLGLFSLAQRIEALQGLYGVRKRNDGKKGSLFWFAIPYRPDDFLARTCGNGFIKPVVKPISTAPAPRSDSFITCCEVLDNYEANIAGSSSLKTTHINSMDARRHLSILLAEDTPMISKMVSMMLTRQGHRVTLAENGEVVLKKVQDELFSGRTMFDVILMDLQMPIMDGLEATRRLREFEVGRDISIRVIGLSANSDPDTIHDALDAGADCFIPKPFEIESFYKALETIDIIRR